MKISRRNLGLGTAALVLLGVGVEGYRRYFGPWYAPTPYDDLLHQIVDRRPAARLGAVAAKAIPNFDAATLAAKLRQPGFGLSRRGRDDGTGDLRRAAGITAIGTHGHEFGLYRKPRLYRARG